LKGLFGGRSAPDPDPCAGDSLDDEDSGLPDSFVRDCDCDCDCDCGCGSGVDCLVLSGNYVALDEHPGFAQFLCATIQSGRQENQALADEHGLENLVDMDPRDILAFVQGKLDRRNASTMIRDEPPISPGDTIYEIFEMILDHYLTIVFPRQESKS
jgi:hypothetical protein